MYTKKRYSVSDMIYWTRIETMIFFVMALIPVVIYDVFDQTWLHLPWLPIALIGTAVAFILGFQNNTVYGRLWEARKIWGGIVNTSRAWAVMVNDYITNDFTESKASDEELAAIRRTLIMRHVAWMTALRHAMRGKRPWENFMQEKSNRDWGEMLGIVEHRVDLQDELDGYLTAEEKAYVMSRTNKAALILSLQSKTLRELRTRGLIDDFRHVEMQHMITALYDSQGKSERIKNFPYPAPVRHAQLDVPVGVPRAPAVRGAVRVRQDRTGDRHEFPTAERLVRLAEHSVHDARDVGLPHARTHRTSGARIRSKDQRMTYPSRPWLVASRSTFERSSARIHRPSRIRFRP